MYRYIYSSSKLDTTLKQLSTNIGLNSMSVSKDRLMLWHKLSTIQLKNPDHYKRIERIYELEDFDNPYSYDHIQFLLKLIDSTKPRSPRL